MEKQGKRDFKKEKYCSGTGTHFEKRSTGRKCQPSFAGAVLSVYTGNRQWERGGDFFSGGGDPVDKSRFYRKDCC